MVKFVPGILSAVLLLATETSAFTPTKSFSNHVSSLRMVRLCVCVFTACNDVIICYYEFLNLIRKLYVYILIRFHCFVMLFFGGLLINVVVFGTSVLRTPRQAQHLKSRKPVPPQKYSGPRRGSQERETRYLDLSANTARTLTS